MHPCTCVCVYWVSKYALIPISPSFHQVTSYSYRNPLTEYFCGIIFKIIFLLLGYTWKKQTNFQHSRFPHELPRGTWTLILQMVIRCCRVSVWHPTPSSPPTIVVCLLLLGRRETLYLTALPGFMHILHSILVHSKSSSTTYLTLKRNKSATCLKKPDMFITDALNFLFCNSPHSPLLHVYIFHLFGKAETWFTRTWPPHSPNQTKPFSFCKETNYQHYLPSL